MSEIRLSGNIQPDDDLRPTHTTRRELLNHALLLGGGLLSLGGCATGNEKLDPKSEAALKLGYVEIASQTDRSKFPNYAAGQSCANCQLVQLRYGPMRPCSLFPDKLVSAKGWCSAWVLRTFDNNKSAG